MTKINKNGQLEWTFEELDFGGAFDEIHEEHERLHIIFDYLFKVTEKMPLDHPSYDVFTVEYKSILKRMNILTKISGYLLRLGEGESFV